MTVVKEDAISESSDPSVDRVASNDESHESIDDSLDEVMLQSNSISTMPPPPPSSSASPVQGAASSFSKPIGTKTLFGMGVVGKPFPGLNRTLGSGDNAAKAEGAASASTTDLLSQVTHALDAQAANARARAFDSTISLPAKAGAEPGSAEAPATAKVNSWVEAEFEDPDDGPTSLTPGIISVAEQVPLTPGLELPAPSVSAEAQLTVAEDSSDDPTKVPIEERSEGSPLNDNENTQVSASLEAISASADPKTDPGVSLAHDHDDNEVTEDEDSVVLGLPHRDEGKSRRAHMLADQGGVHGSTPLRLPTPPMGNALASLGRPRPNTPLSSLSLPAPPLTTADGKRLTLPPGTQAPVIPLRHAADDVGGEFGVPGFSSEGLSRSAVETQPLAAYAPIPVTDRRSAGSTIRPNLLKAYVKLGTITLAGMIGATFFGGLGVGIVVGRGHNEATPPTSGVASIHAPDTNTNVVPPPPSVAPSAPVVAAVPPAPTVAAPVAAATPGAAERTTAKPTSQGPVGGPSVDPIVAPMAEASTATPEPAVVPQPKPLVRPAVRVAPRPRPAVVVREAQATTPPPLPVAKAVKPVVPPKAPTAIAAAATATKSTGVAAKSTAKDGKTKAAWHDPFAD